ncbi:hypothetical protein FJT64_020565 [Amphibalanus amphitrite]|uniref:Uncharacterized protein n=1 Tax=Amphibalanus amphitrite TaxID=1232801 RepID=A0A6A4X1A4_AMPAM|nr:hypothetical protein FJT64_020565 [Amphibalanus amphitrite]
METETLRDAAERRTEKIIDGSLKGEGEKIVDGSLKESFDGMLTVTPVLMVLIVAVGGLLIIIIIVVVLLRMRGRPTSRRRGTPPLTGLQMKEMGHQAEGDSKNPDLIQTHGESSHRYTVQTIETRSESSYTEGGGQ